MDSEELKRLLNEAYDAQSLKKFNAALNKANAQAESLSEAQKKELAQFKKLGDAREKLIRASSNLSDRFAKQDNRLEWQTTRPLHLVKVRQHLQHL